MGCIIVLPGFLPLSLHVLAVCDWYWKWWEQLDSTTKKMCQPPLKLTETISPAPGYKLVLKPGLCTGRPWAALITFVLSLSWADSLLDRIWDWSIDLKKRKRRFPTEICFPLTSLLKHLQFQSNEPRKQRDKIYFHYWIVGDSHGPFSGPPKICKCT